MNRNILNPDSPLTEQLDTNTIIITGDGTAYRITDITPGGDSDYVSNEHAETVTVQNLVTTDKTTFVTPSSNEPFNLGQAQIVPETVVQHPEDILHEYATHHLSNDIRVLGRTHNHTIGGSIGIIEYALKAAYNKNYPPNNTH